MTANKSHFYAVLMSRVLSVSRSGYYGWTRRKPSAQAQDNVTLDAAITDVFTAKKRPRVQANGITAGRHRVARHMRTLQLRAKSREEVRGNDKLQSPLAGGG